MKNNFHVFFNEGSSPVIGLMINTSFTLQYENKEDLRCENVISQNSLAAKCKSQVLCEQMHVFYVKT